MIRYVSIFLLAGIIMQCRYKPEEPTKMFVGKPTVPSSIKKEHTYLLGQLRKITLLPDSTGNAAKKIYELLQHHFQEEEDYVLPPLGILPSLVNGQQPEEAENVIKLAEKIKSQSTHMNIEHQMLKAYMNELKNAASGENHPEVIEFEKQLTDHATIEEEVLFPAAILVGEYLKLKASAKTGETSM